MTFLCTFKLFPTFQSFNWLPGNTFPILCNYFLGLYSQNIFQRYKHLNSRKVLAISIAINHLPVSPVFFSNILFYFSNFMHKLYPIMVLICISIRGSKVEHFLMSVCYLGLLFVNHLFISLAHLHQSWYFSFQFSWAFCAILTKDFPLVYLMKIFPLVCLPFVWVMIIFILETCKHFPPRFIQFIESLECIILLHIWCLLFFFFWWFQMFSFSTSTLV